MIIRCHSYSDGYWADSRARTILARLKEERRAMFEAVFAARDTVLAAIRARCTSGRVGQIARAVFESHDLGPHSSIRQVTGRDLELSTIQLARDYTRNPMTCSKLE